MPELPEVELVARALEKSVAGRRILSAELLRPRLAPDHSSADFSALLRNRRITGVSRRGKHILISLSDDRTLIVHLRMSGRFLYVPADVQIPKFTHAIFNLDSGRRLIFTDQRHFGFMKIVRACDLETTKEIRKLAPEPFSADFTPEYLLGALRRSRRSIKETLIDQTKVTGLGNIYAAEVMFLARVNPSVTASKVSSRRATKLHRAILEVFDESIRHGSTLQVDPEDLDSSYYGGDYEGHWRVYDREGDPCPNCSARIRRVVHAGRSTYFCPRCQRR